MPQGLIRKKMNYTQIESESMKCWCYVVSVEPFHVILQVEATYY